MSKNFTFVANLSVPDDEFERAEVLGQIKPHIDQLRNALHEISGGEAIMSHSITTPRAAKPAPVGTGSSEAAAVTHGGGQGGASSRRHKPEAVAA